MRWAWFVVLAGCGRVAFDPLADAGGTSRDPASEVPGVDAGRVVGTPDAAAGSMMPDAAVATTCPVIPKCPEQGTGVGPGTNSNTVQSVVTNHGLASTGCGFGAGTPEIAIELQPSVAGMYRVNVSPASARFYIHDLCCGGVEIACGLPPLYIMRNADQTFIVLVEGPVGTNYTVSAAHTTN